MLIVAVFQPTESSVWFGRDGVPAGLAQRPTRQISTWLILASWSGSRLWTRGLFSPETGDKCQGREPPRPRAGREDESARGWSCVVELKSQTALTSHSGENSSSFAQRTFSKKKKKKVSEGDVWNSSVNCALCWLRATHSSDPWEKEELSDEAIDVKSRIRVVFICSKAKPLTSAAAVTLWIGRF